MTPLLRPLSFSETLDRAFGLALRTLLPVGAIAAVFLGMGFGAAYAVLRVAVVARAPSAVPAALAVTVFFGALVLTLGAATSVQLDAYLGRRPKVRQVLGDALRSWRRLSLLLLLYFGVLIVPAALVIALADGGLWVFDRTAFFRTVAGSATALAIALPFFLAVLATYGFMQCLGGVAGVGCVAEWSGPLEAWRRGWQRCVAGGRWRRTLVLGALMVFVGFALSIALQLIAFGIAALIGSVAFGGADPVASFVLQAGVVLFDFFYIVFQYAWLVVYYFDLRVRSEGLDLVLRSDSLGRLPASGAAGS